MTKIAVFDSSLSVVSREQLNTGSENYYEVSFVFNETWDDYDKYVVFYQIPTQPKFEAELTAENDYTVKIPNELLIVDIPLLIGCYGVNDETAVGGENKIISTNFKDLSVNQGAFSDDLVSYENVSATIVRSKENTIKFVRENDDGEFEYSKDGEEWIKVSYKAEYNELLLKIKESEEKLQAEISEMSETIKEDIAPQLEALQEETEEKFSDLQDDIDGKFKTVDDKFSDVDKKFKAVDEKFETVETRITTIGTQFVDLSKEVNDKFSAVETKIDEKIEEVEKTITTIGTQFVDLSNKVDTFSDRISSIETEISQSGVSNVDGVQSNLGLEKRYITSFFKSSWSYDNDQDEYYIRIQADVHKITNPYVSNVSLTDVVDRNNNVLIDTETTMFWEDDIRDNGDIYIWINKDLRLYSTYSGKIIIKGNKK